MANATEELRVSRVGKVPVDIPNNVTVEIRDGGQTVKVAGPKGELERTFHSDVKIEREGEQLKVVPGLQPKRFAQFQGLSRALLRNMVQGCSEGFKVSLDFYGVGYRATVDGQELELSLGLSHTVHHTLHRSVKAQVETLDQGGTKRPRLHLESHDKEALGQQAARIRSYRPPEPYKGKGVRYTGERIREKAGKAGG